MRGTVVGINTSTLDALWDGPIMSGSTLGGRCSENRGSIVPRSSVLNLTNPTVVALTKAAQSRKPEPVSSADNSRTGSPAQATRAQLHRTGGPASRGRGGKWYTPWGLNTASPNNNSPTRSGPSPKSGSAPFNPTILLRNSNGPAAQLSPSAQSAHQYRNGVAIPPPPDMDQPRPKIRSGPPKIASASPPSTSASTSAAGGHTPTRTPRGGGNANGFRGGRGGRGGGGRGGAANRSPLFRGRGGGRGRGRGGQGPTPQS